MQQDDDELTRLLAGDVRHHFRSVVELHQHRLYAFAYRLTSSPGDAEDIVQEAFVRAYVALQSYPAERIQSLKLHSWLYAITLNEFRHHARGARLHLVPMDLSDESALLTIEDSATQRPDLLTEYRERRQELEAAVATLPERYRLPLTLYYFEGFAYQEIADLLEQPLGTVKSAIFRGVRLLRAHFDAQRRVGKEEDRWNTKVANGK